MALRDERSSGHPATTSRRKPVCASAAIDLATILMKAGSAGSSSSANGSGGDAFWETLATAPLAAILRAAGADGIDWARSAVGRLAPHAGDDGETDRKDTDSPCWANAIGRLEVAGCEMLAHELASAAELEAKMRDSVTITMKSALAPWWRSTVVGRGGERPFVPTMLEHPRSTLFVVAPATGVAAGAAVAVLLEFGIAWAWFGGGALSGYVHNFNSVMELRPLLEAQPEAMHSLLAFFSLLLPSASLAKAAYVFSSLAVGVLAVWTWKGQAPLELRYAVLVIATVLVSPHLYTYDLVVLAPAFFLTASWLLGSSRRSLALWVLLYLAYYLSSLEGLVHLTKVQWTVPVLVSLLIHLAASARREALTPA